MSAWNVSSVVHRTDSYEILPPHLAVYSTTATYETKLNSFSKMMEEVADFNPESGLLEEQRIGKFRSGKPN